MSVGNILKKVRLEHDLTLDELAQRLNKNQGLNISKSMVSRWENNKAEPINTFLSAYAREFSLDMNTLLGLEDHYLHDDTQALAEDLHKGGEYQILLDAPKKLSKKQLDALIDTIESMIKMNEDS